MSVSSRVIVGDLDLESITISPRKADAPLVIDANAVLAAAATFQLLEAIARRFRHVGEGTGSV
jgi:hypothetical protein